MRVLIADDHDLLRDTLVAFFQTDGGIETSTAATLAEACACIEREELFDLVLLDYQMPGMNGLAGLKTVIGLRGGQTVALMSGVASHGVAQKALEAGAAGFLPKTMPARSMINAMRFMALGERFVPADFHDEAAEVPGNALAERLTPRELQVLKGLSQGASNKEIARELGLQEPTVKLHVKTLYRKIGAANRTQAALIAREAGLE